MSPGDSYLNWKVKSVESLPANDQKFLERLYSGDRERYMARLRNIGFENLGAVLDAGAGFGQWAISLSQLGNRVYPIDIDMRRNRVLAEVATANLMNAVFAAQSTLEELPFQDGIFDGIFSFSSIYFTRYRLALGEFGRVLKPGGLLYINTNDLGWFLYLLVTAHNSTAGYSPRRYAFRSVRNTLLGSEPPYTENFGSQFIPAARLVSLLQQDGFEVLALEGDGMIRCSEAAEARPLLPARYLGVRAVYEILARKL